MSLAATRWTLAHLADPDCSLSLGARAAALVLADCADATGQTWAGRSHVGKILGLSPRQTATYLIELRAWSHLPVVDRPGHSSIWHFPPGVDAVHSRAESRTGQLSTVVQDHAGGRAGSRTGDVQDPAPDPTNEPTNEKSAPAPASANGPRAAGVPLTGRMTATEVRAILEREIAKARAERLGRTGG